MNVQSLNSVTIMGRLGSDPRVKTGQYGTICSLSVATTRRFRAADGNVSESTVWIPCSIFGSLADNATKLLKKGDLVCMIGGINVRQTNERQYFDVRVQEFQLLSRANSNTARYQSTPATESDYVEQEVPAEQDYSNSPVCDQAAMQAQPAPSARPQASNHARSGRHSSTAGTMTHRAQAYQSRAQRYQQAMRHPHFENDPTDLPFEEMGL